MSDLHPHNARCASLLGQGCDCRSPWGTEVGARIGQRLTLTRGPNRLAGLVTSDSVTWITLRLDTGCSLAVDLDGWKIELEDYPDFRPMWVRGLHRLWGAR